MRKFLNCLKETYRFLKNGEEEISPKLSLMIIFVAFVTCIVRFINYYIKRITKREN
jgi:hypothetical protein